MVAALQLEGKNETANFIQQVLTFWNIVNVATKGENEKFNNPNRAVQTKSSTNLQSLLQLFENSRSGHGPTRCYSLTHDTRKALVQTIGGLIAVCDFLFSVGFEYVQLREIQSDRIEHEFGIYRRSTGCNSFMVSSDVLSAYQKRLAKFSATFLNSVDSMQSSTTHLSHTCDEIDFDTACVVENLSDTNLTGFEEYSVAYVAGWLEAKCQDIEFFDEDPQVAGIAKDFIEEVSRGKLTTPHVSTNDFVRAALCFVKRVKYQVCCREQLMSILDLINSHYRFGLFPTPFLRRLSNVLLKGIHKLEKDVQPKSILYETAIKRARHAK